MTYRLNPLGEFRWRAFAAAATLCVGFLSYALSEADAAILSVGFSSEQTFPTLSAAVAAAKPGDTIRLAPGEYVDDFAVINVPVTIEGDGGTAVLIARSPIPNGKAILVVNADLTVRNLEFRDAKVPDRNGAGIRAQRGNIAVEHCIFTDNESGILTAADSTMALNVRDSVFIGNGFGDGYSHGIYAGRIAALAVSRSTFTGTKVGHDIKSRAAVTVLTSNTLDDGKDGTTSLAVDIPNGGNATIIGNTIRQGERTENPVMISFAAEGVAYQDNALLIANNTFVNTRRGNSIAIDNRGPAAAQVRHNTFMGVGTKLRGLGRIE
ncbi:MAG: hypothetical protein KDE14_13575 [Rhodobacteraceae bacterium]|nr:hypothetical protein [Paracoccaceae bacterium]